MWKFWKKKTLISRRELNEKVDKGLKIVFSELQNTLADRFLVWHDLAKIPGLPPKNGLSMEFTYLIYHFKMSFTKKTADLKLENYEVLCNDIYFNLTQLDFNENPYCYCGEEFIRLVRVALDFDFKQFIIETFDLEITRQKDRKLKFVQQIGQIDQYLIKERGSIKFDFFKL